MPLIGYPFYYDLNYRRETGTLEVQHTENKIQFVSQFPGEVAGHDRSQNLHRLK